MKSLLVDALRQIEDGATETPTADEQTVADSDSLELTLDDGADTLASPAPEATARGLEFEEAEPRHEIASDADDAAEISLGIELSAEDSQMPAAPIATPPVDASLDAPAPAASVTMAPALSTRYLLLTPLACLILGAASAASYLAYTTLGAGATDHAGVAAAAPDVSAAESRMPAGYSFSLDTTGNDRVGKAAALALDTGAAAPEPVRLPATRELRASMPKADPAYPLLMEAFAAWQSGDVAVAERRYREALAVSPRHPNALEGLGAVLRHTGRDDEALPVYESLLALDPGNDVAAAALVAATSSNASGIDELRKLMERHPNSAPLYDALGEALAADDRWADARVSFERAAGIAPHRADYVFNLAVALDRLGRSADAEAHYRRSLELETAGSGIDRGVVTARLRELAPSSAGDLQ